MLSDHMYTEMVTPIARSTFLEKIPMVTPTVTHVTSRIGYVMGFPSVRKKRARMKYKLEPKYGANHEDSGE